MPKLATGRNSCRVLSAKGSSGYSLIELLAVIIIAGLLTTLAVLQFSGDSEAERAERSLDQLTASIDLLCDQALLNGQVRGLRLTNEGYDFWMLIDNRWQSQAADQRPHARAWPDGLPVEIMIEQRRISTVESSQPQLWCSALEPMAAFEVQLGRGNASQNRHWPTHAD